jgi:hypothetical protein
MFIDELFYNNLNFWLDNNLDKGNLHLEFGDFNKILGYLLKLYLLLFLEFAFNV